MGNDVTELKKACAALLALLPECRCEPDGLARAADYFDVPAGQIREAARQLPKNHDLSYRGIRLLLGECVREFLRLFHEDDGRKVCEVTVPAPLALMMTLQDAAEDVRFSSGAMLAQTVIRGLLLDEQPQDITSCAKRRCGLNKMRHRLISAPPGRRPDYLLQYGVLCDECVKSGEGFRDRVGVASLMLPKGAANADPARREGLRQMAAAHIEAACAMMNIRVSDGAGRAALGRYARLMRVQKALLSLNARPDRQPLYGNSFALAQAVQLMVFDDWEAVISALELLAAELQDAPPDDGAKRLYAFFTPFLQPGIERRFRENGVCLLGNAAFLFDATRLSFDLEGHVTDWFTGLNVAADTRSECRRIAEEMARCGAAEYLTGAFAFDRWMGAAVPMQRRILKEQYGISTVLLDADFWCENVMFGSITERVDNLCATSLPD